MIKSAIADWSPRLLKKYLAAFLAVALFFCISLDIPAHAVVSEAAAAKFLAECTAVVAQASGIEAGTTATASAISSAWTPYIAAYAAEQGTTATALALTAIPDIVTTVAGLIMLGTTAASIIGGIIQKMNSEKNLASSGDTATLSTYSTVVSSINGETVPYITSITDWSPSYPLYYDFSDTFAALVDPSSYLWDLNSYLYDASDGYYSLVYNVASVGGIDYKICIRAEASGSTISKLWITWMGNSVRTAWPVLSANRTYSEYYGNVSNNLMYFYWDGSRLKQFFLTTSNTTTSYPVAYNSTARYIIPLVYRLPKYSNSGTYPTGYYYAPGILDVFSASNMPTIDGVKYCPIGGRSIYNNPSFDNYAASILSVAGPSSSSLSSSSVTYTREPWFDASLFSVPQGKSLTIDTGITITDPDAADALDPVIASISSGTADFSASITDNDPVPSPDEWENPPPVGPSYPDGTPEDDYPTSDPSGDGLFPGDIFSNIWHYVLEVIAYGSSGLSLISDFWNSLPYASKLPLYASIVVTFVFGVLSRLLM